MKFELKAYLKRILQQAMAVFSRTNVGQLINEEMIKDVMNRTYTTDHGNIRICLTVPNWINRYRATTFSEKEPETLEWIDSLEKESVLWDVGANVGLYSIYAVKKRKCSVKKQLFAT